MKECQHCLPCHLPKYYWPIDWGEILLANIVQEDIYHHLKALHKGSSQSAKLKIYTFSQNEKKRISFFCLNFFIVEKMFINKFGRVQRCSGLLWDDDVFCLFSCITFPPKIIKFWIENFSENITEDHPIGKNKKNIQNM